MPIADWQLLWQESNCRLRIGERQGWVRSSLPSELPRTLVAGHRKIPADIVCWACPRARPVGKVTGALTNPATSVTRVAVGARDSRERASPGLGAFIPPERTPPYACSGAS